MRSGNLDFLNSVLFPQQGQAGGSSEAFKHLLGPLAAPGIQQFLGQPTPERQALNTALPALQEILTPGTHNPQFDSDLAMANQSGGRFGSANAILRGEAYKNLFNARTQAANTLGVLGQGAGSGDQRQAGLMDMETSRRLQILMSLLGTSQSASFNLPFVTQPSTLDSIGQVAAIPATFLGGGGGGANGNTAATNQLARGGGL